MYIKRDVEFKQKYESLYTIEIEIAAQYTTSSTVIEESFANRYKLRQGQSYMYWLQTAFLDFMNRYAYEMGILIEGDKPFTRKEALTGLITVISISNLHPQQPHEDRCDLPYRELRKVMYKFGMDTLDSFNFSFR